MAKASAISISRVLPRGSSRRSQHGRFISPDTIVPYPGNPQAFNRYSYAGNNPVTYLEDGNGWFIPFIIAAIKGAAIGAAVGAATAAITGGNIGQGALFGAIGGAAFAGLSSVFTSFAKFAMLGTTNVSLIGNTATTLSIISGAVGGAAAGAAVAGTTGSNVGRGALAGLTAATIAGVGSNVWPLGAAAIGGGAASEIEGGEFGEGAKFAAIGRSMGTMLELAVPADTIGEQNPQPGDLAYMKPENPLTALISLLEGGPFSHVKILDNQGRWISATPQKGVDDFFYNDYSGRRGKLIRRFRGNQRVIAAAKAQAVTNPPLPYNFVIGGRGRVCSTCVGNAISIGAGIQWTGIGPNSQFNVFRSYGE